MNSANIEKVIAVLEDMQSVERHHLSLKWNKEKWRFISEE